MTKDGFYRKYEYVYDEYYDCYICPENQILSYHTTNREVIKGGCFEYLAEEELYQLHMASCEILERTGVEVLDEEALELLRAGGAHVDGTRVRIPTAMVEKAIQSAPSRIPFCAIDNTYQLQLFRNNVYYGLGTDLPKFIDPYTGELRDTVLKDVENVGKVAQAAKNIDFVASLGLAQNVDNRIVDLYHLAALRKYCNKPNWTTATDYGNMKALIDMAAVSAGGYDELKRRPTIGLYGEPITPLINFKEAAQKLLLCAEYSIPVTWASGIMGGGQNYHADGSAGSRRLLCRYRRTSGQTDQHGWS